MHEQQNKQPRPEVTPYDAEEMARRVYIPPTSEEGEVRTGIVTGEASEGDKVYYEVTSIAEDGAVVSELMSQETLDSFDAAERERRVSNRAQNMGDIALRAPALPPEVPPHDPSSNAMPMAEVRKLLEEADLAGKPTQPPLIEVPAAWRKPHGE